MTEGRRSRYTREAGRVHAVGYKQRVSVARCPGADRWWCPVEDCPTEHAPKPDAEPCPERNR